jgi:hypothetical protein
MKQKKVTHRFTLSELRSKTQQNSAKIDLLEDRLRRVESNELPRPVSTRMKALKRSRDMIYSKTIKVQRAGSCLLKGVSSATSEISSAANKAFKALIDSRQDVSRDLEKSVTKSKEAIQTGLNKARHDVDKSAKVAMRIVSG